MFYQADLFETAEPGQGDPPESLDLAALIERIADISARPRYAFMVLNLIAKAAGKNSGSAGPCVIDGDRRIALRDWLCDCLIPMAKRDARRLAIVKEVRAALIENSGLPADPHEAAQIIDEHVRARVRHPGDAMSVAPYPIWCAPASSAATIKGTGSTTQIAVRSVKLSTRSRMPQQERWRAAPDRDG